MKLLRMLTVIAILMISTMTASAQTESDRPIDIWGTHDHSKISLHILVRGSWPGIQTPTTTIGSFPLSVRQIPGHKNDPWAGKIFTVPDATFIDVTHPRISAVAMFGGSVTFYDRLTVRLGVTFINIFNKDQDENALTNFYDPTSSGHPYLREINQLNQPNRGVGTALVYYELTPRWETNNTLLVLTPEVEVKIARGFSVLGGYYRYGYGYNVVRGYDRYNSLADIISTEPIIAVKMFVPYAGVCYEIMHNEGAQISFVTLYSFPSAHLQIADDMSGLQTSLQPTQNFFSAGFTLGFKLFKK